MVEMALAMPFVFILLVGATQVGTIAYGMVSTDTAAREAGRIGQQTPHDSLDPVAAAGGQYTCASPTDSNPICIAAYSSAGLLDKTKMTVTIKLRGSSLLSQLYRPPTDVIQVGSNPNSPCNGSQAKVTGTVGGLPSGQTAQVSSTTGGSSVTATDGTYTLCASASSSGTTGTLSANLLYNGCTYSAAISNVTLVKNTQYSGENLTLGQSCPTTTTTTSTGTTTGTSTTSTSTVTVTTTTVSAFTCSQTVTYPAFFTVTIRYPVNIFVPFVGQLFADNGSGSVRTVSATVTEEIAPCGVTDNQ